MFKGFVNRMYQGNPNRPDYNPDNMPENRFKLFTSVLGVRIWSLIYISLILDAFLLPTLLWTLFNLSFVFNSSVLQPINTTITVYLWILIPCLMIFAPAVAGATYVLRNWARDQHAEVWGDFWYSFRQNWKQAMLVGLVDGVLLYFLYFNGNFYSSGYFAGIMGATFGQILITVMIALSYLLAMSNIFIFPLMVTYEMSFGKLVRNSILLMLARLPHLIGFSIIALIPLILAIWLVQPMILGVYLIIGFGFFGLMFNSFTNAVFDKLINPKIEGAVIGRGLRKTDEDEE